MPCRAEWFIGDLTTVERLHTVVGRIVEGNHPSGTPVSLYFMHVNTRHHSLAIAQGPRSRMNHLMMEFYSLDDVGQSYDIAQREDRVAVKFGRHPNDFMTSFYMRTPSDFLIEHGCGGREVSPGWQPVELKSVGSFWGHQGLFESLGEGPPPPDAPPHPPMPALEPNHAPLQVIDGNYERMSGVLLPNRSAGREPSCR